MTGLVLPRDETHTPFLYIGAPVLVRGTLAGDYDLPGVLLGILDDRAGILASESDFILCECDLQSGCDLWLVEVEHRKHTYPVAACTHLLEPMSSNRYVVVYS